MFVQRTQVLKISLFAILSAFAVELAFGLIFNSLGLITDSVHALLDSIVTVVLLLAARLAIKPPDAEHTYGHGKIETLGGLFGGIAILLIAVFFIYESLVRLQSPEPEVLPSIIAIIAGIYTIGVDIFRIVLLGKSIRKIGGSTLKADFYHALMDLGSTIVAIVGILLVTTGFYQGDFIAALVLGVLLVALSLKLIYRTAMDLTDIISPGLVTKVREISLSTEGVIGVGPILMRKSGETIFCDVTISLRGNVSFDRAHEISAEAEKNIKKEISNCITLVHFEPSWQDVPKESKINDVAMEVDGVKGVHNISSYSSEGKIFVSLHIMVERDKNLEQAHKISEIVEEKIQKSIPEIHHITIHLEPFVTIPEKLKVGGKTMEEKIGSLLDEYSEIKKVSRVVILQYKNIQKIDIDCSFDGNLSIEKVHDLISQIERKIRSQFKNAVITIHPEPN
jgi:cation diffusion facilitator family transporter